MTYANPAYMLTHRGADIGTANITPKYAAATGFGLENLIDYRSSKLFKFAASQTDHDIEFDFGSLAATPYINRVYIPIGHNFVGTPANLRIYADSTSPAASLVDSYPTPAAGVAVDWELPITVHSRYVRLLFDGAGTWELPELWLGERLETSRGIDPGWEEPYRLPSEVVEFPTRELVSVLGPARRSWSMQYHQITESPSLLSPPDTSDHRTLLELSQHSRSTPLVFWPPEVSAEPLIVRLVDEVGVSQDSPNPQVKLNRGYSVSVLEQTS